MATQRLATEDRRAQITDAALRLIATDGIAALTTATVAREVGVTTGALFRHFASLDEVLEAVADRVAGLLESTYPSPELPPRERLERFFDARTALAVERAGIPRLVLSEQFAHALPERARAVVRDAVRRTHAFVAAALADGQREGTIRDDVAPEPLAVIVIGSMQMIALHASLRSRGAPRATEIRDALFAMIEPARSSAPRRKR